MRGVSNKHCLLTFFIFASYYSAVFAKQTQWSILVRLAQLVAGRLKFRHSMVDCKLDCAFEHFEQLLFTENRFVSTKYMYTFINM